MKNEVTYHNKDVMSKVLAENFKNKPLSVYGLDVPAIKDVVRTVRAVRYSCIFG